MNVIREDPLLITSVSVTSNPDVFAKPMMKGSTQLAFPVTTNLRKDGKMLVVDGTLISKGVLDDGKTPMYTASCTGRVAYFFDEPLENYEERSREIYDQFIKPVYCVLASKLQQLIMSIGLIVTFPLAIPPMEDVKRVDSE